MVFPQTGLEIHSSKSTHVFLLDVNIQKLMLDIMFLLYLLHLKIFKKIKHQQLFHQSNFLISNFCDINYK